MSFEENAPRFRVDRSYENEFGLVASSAVLSIITFGLLLTVIMPPLTWAFVGTTTGAVTKMDPITNLSTLYFPITIEEFSLWDNSCDTPGMVFTYNVDLCNARYQTVEAFSTLACICAILGLIFGIMPFSPVAPREPKQALTHSMLSHMAAGMFALVSWSTFYGGLVNGVWASVNPAIADSGLVWEYNVLVTNGGIVAVSGWVGAFLSWVLSLSAMIKYDAAAAEQAILAKKQKKERRTRKKQEMIDRLGEGASRAAHDGISLELGDKLYLGGTIAAGGTAAVAWANNSLSSYLLSYPFVLPILAGTLLILGTLASTVVSLVLLAGLSDLIPRPKASVGGFAVFSVLCVMWIFSFGIILYFLTVLGNGTQEVLAMETTLGSLGICCSLCTTVVLYHPFKIWEKDFAELPRPAKIHRGGANGLALVLTCAASCLLGFCLCMAAITVFAIPAEDFVGGGQSSPIPPSSSPNATTPQCANGPGDICNVGTQAERCCNLPYACMETAYTRYTCVLVDSDHHLQGIRDVYAVGQAFLALTIAFSAVAYVFAALSLAPNGVMDVFVALSVVYSMSLIASLCGVVSFSVLQGYVISNGGLGMPMECGYLLGSFASLIVGSITAFCASRSYREHVPTLTEELFQANQRLQLEQAKLETIKVREERVQLEKTLQEHAEDADVEERAVTATDICQE